MGLSSGWDPFASRSATGSRPPLPAIDSPSQFILSFSVRCVSICVDIRLPASFLCLYTLLLATKQAIKPPSSHVVCLNIYSTLFRPHYLTSTSRLTSVLTCHGPGCYYLHLPSYQALTITGTVRTSGPCSPYSPTNEPRLGPRESRILVSRPKRSPNCYTPIYNGQHFTLCF